jgi:hypothetical protein
MIKGSNRVSDPFRIIQNLPKTSNWSGTLLWTHRIMKQLYAFYLAEARYYKTMVQSELITNFFGGHPF